MYSFSEKSKAILATVDPRLQEIANEAIKLIDFTVTEGKRTLERQKQLVDEGKSKTLESKHLTGKAIDIAPWPIDYNYLPAFYYLAGIMISIAHNKGYKLRWGGNWSMKNDFKNNSFLDAVHFEILD